MSDVKELVERLRGVYRVPVNDGGGPLPGHGAEFTRRFDVPPIQLEAADWIERWSPVVEAARQYARSKKIMQEFDAFLPNTEHLLIECHSAAREKLLNVAVALGEDKP